MYYGVETTAAYGCLVAGQSMWASAPSVTQKRCCSCSCCLWCYIKCYMFLPYRLDAWSLKSAEIIEQTH